MVESTPSCLVLISCCLDQPSKSFWHSVTIDYRLDKVDSKTSAYLSWEGSESLRWFFLRFGDWWTCPVTVFHWLCFEERSALTDCAWCYCLEESEPSIEKRWHLLRSYSWRLQLYSGSNLTLCDLSCYIENSSLFCYICFVVIRFSSVTEYRDLINCCSGPLGRRDPLCRFSSTAWSSAWLPAKRMRTSTFERA